MPANWVKEAPCTADSKGIKYTASKKRSLANTHIHKVRVSKKEFSDCMYIKIESRGDSEKSEEEETMTTEVTVNPTRRNNKAEWIYKDTLYVWFMH